MIFYKIQILSDFYMAFYLQKMTFQMEKNLISIRKFET